MSTDSLLSDSDKIIQLMRPGALGDLLMCTAPLAALKEQGYFIRFVAHPKFSAILEGHPYIDELITVKPGSPGEMMGAVNRLNLPPADRMVYFTYPFYSKRDLPGHPISIPVTHHYCDQAEVPVTDVLSVGLTREHEEWGKQFSDEILVHTTAMWSPYKNWPLDRWQALSNKIELELDVSVLQLGTGTDRLLGTDKLIDSPSILHAIAAIKYCRLFIGQDSVFNHATRAVDKPSIILWGSTHPLGHGYSQNLNLVNGVVWQKPMGYEGPSLRCQPCYREYSGPGNNNAKRTCPYTIPYFEHTLPEKMHPEKEINACMASQSMETVFNHVQPMLDNPQDHLRSFMLRTCN